MNIAIASDHRGYELKEKIKNFLSDEKVNFTDFGPVSEESVDYPDYAKLVAENVKYGESNFGILICGSGIGMDMSANRIKGVRAVNVSSEKQAEMSRRHNNANIICLGADYIKYEDAVRYIKIFLNTEFEGGRHQRRVDKMDII